MIDRGFFSQDTAAVARSLVGRVLVVDPGTGGEVRALVVEIEAYLGRDDPASHAFRGPTKRAAIMFGAPGRLYVYLSYGMHHCANIVTEVDGMAGAVLLRAAAVISGEPVVRLRREGPGGQRLSPDALLRGPGNLCRGLAIDRSDNGLDLCATGSRIQVVAGSAAPDVDVGCRVGIRHATDRRLRFCLRSHPAVSSPRPQGGP